ncbi:AAA family ATPase [Halodurantibacterium flavum]|uniref:CpaE family protein n=1 Tax=Halodurantibacterium flavum TaxID=1382802 RepID=A0ABW4S8E1_9RHOB
MGRPIETIHLPRADITAYWATPETGAFLDRARVDRRFASTTIEVHPGGIEAAIRSCAAARSPDLLILEAPQADEGFLADLERLAEHCLPHTRVIVLGAANEVGVFRAFVAHGVSDYLALPVTVPDLALACGRALPTDGAGRQGRIVACLGVRGGAGASSVTQTLAGLIAEDLTLETLLADLDTAGGSLGLALGVEGQQNATVEAMKNAERLDQALFDRLAARPHPRLAVLSGHPDLEIGTATLASLMPAFAATCRRYFPMTLLDLPRGWDGLTRSAVGLADAVLLVATPDLTSLRNARLLLAQLAALRPDDEPPHIVLNQIGLPQQEQIAPARFAEALGKPLSARLGFNPRSLPGETCKIADRRLREALLPLATSLCGAQMRSQPAPRQGLGRLVARLLPVG